MSGTADDNPAAAEVNVVLLIDRFVSASTAPDVLESLESILSALQKDLLDATTLLEEAAAAAAQDPDNPDIFWKGLLHILQTQETAASNNNLPVGDEGSNLVARIYKQLCTSSSSSKSVAQQLLETPEPGLLLQALVDVAVGDHGAQEEDDTPHLASSSYTRVVCLQTLRHLCTAAPKTAQAQLLQAPNGLHRLGQLLSPALDDAAVRNEALLLAAQPLATWASVAKVWMFQDVGLTVLQLALQEGGLTGGSVLVEDCLRLLGALLQHDSNLADLLWANNASQLGRLFCQLIDLRLGTAFLNPDQAPPPLSRNNNNNNRRGSSNNNNNQKSAKDQPAKGKTTVKDDLDDLMNSGTTSKSKEGTSSTAASSQKSEQAAEQQPQQVQLPYLTDGEERIIGAVLDVLTTVLENKSVQQQVWQNQPDLVLMIWQMSLLVAPAQPPPGQPALVFQHAYPSVALQQRGLQFVALYLNDPGTMEQLSGLDRLLMLVCTGGNLGAETLADKLPISLSALHAIRRTLTPERTTKMLLHTLAPAPMDDGGGVNVAARDAEIVHRLVNTVAGNLVAPNDPNQQTVESQERRTILLSGSLGSLAVFLTDDASRAMLLRLTANSGRSEDSASTGGGGGGLLDSILHVLGGGEHISAGGANDGDEDAEELKDNSYRAYVQQEQDVVVQLVLLRFLCHWVEQAPSVVHSILQSPHSAVLSTLVNNNSNRGSSTRPPRDETVISMASLLLGLIMEYMGNDETLCGGWTRAGILQVLTKKRGVSQLTRRLERLKTAAVAEKLPWTAHCQLEQAVWTAWYEPAVLLVRKRVVRELTTAGDDGEDDTDDDENGAGVGSEHGGSGDAATTSATTSTSQKALRRLVSQQTAELDELRAQLHTAEQTLSVQEKQLATWKQRVESTPTQLDEMLTETTAKNAQLVQQVETLEETTRTMEEKHTAELKARDETIESLRNELAESKAREDEARQDLESTREEMTALSQAYSSLEEEYQRQGAELSAATAAAASAPAETASAASAQQTGEGGEETPPQQPQGEMSQQTPSGGGGGSTEVATLRSALARQREDNKAAEDWMAMAVGKMTEFSNSNAALQQEVTSLRTQLHELESRPPPKDEALEQRQSQLVTEMSSMTQQLQDERNLRAETEKQLESYRVQIEDTSRALQHADTDRGELTQRVDGLTAELDHYRTQIQETGQQLQSSDADRTELLKRVDALTAELDRVRSEAAAAAAASSQQVVQPAAAEAPPPADSEEIASLRQTIDNLNEELEAARADLGSSKHHDQEEIYHREARIRELESRLSEGLGSYTIEDIRSKDEEIAELQQSNDAAQEWMGKAVEHTQTLSDQIASLTQDNKALNVQVRDLSSQLELNQNASETIARLETEVQGRDLEINRISAELAEKESQLVQTINAGTEARTELETKSKDELVALNFKLAEVTHELQGRSSELDALRLDLSSKNDAMKALQARNDELVAASARQEEEIATLKSRSEQVQHAGPLPDSSAAAEDAETMKEQPSSSSEIAELKMTVKNLEDQLAEQEKDSNEVAAQWEEAYKGLETRCSELENELSQRPSSSAEGGAAEEVGRIVELTSEVKSLSQQLQNSRDNAMDVEQRWKKSYEELEERCQALRNENEEQKSKLAVHGPKASEGAEDKDTRVVELTSQLETLSEQLRDSQKEAMTTIEQWQSSYEALETQLATLTKKEDVQEHVDPSSSSLDELEEKNNRIAELSSQLESLSQELQQSEASAAETVDQWKASYVGLESSFESLKEENEKLKSNQGPGPLADSGESASRIVELTSQVENLSQKLKDSEAEAMTTIQQWQASYNELETRLVEATSNKGNAGSPLAAPSFDSTADLNEKDRRIAELENLTQNLRESEADAATAIEQWQSSHAELETKLGALTKQHEELKANQTDGPNAAALTDLEEKDNRIAELEGLNQQLQASETDASSVIQEWQASYAGLESKLEALTKEYEELKAAKPADGQKDGPAMNTEEKDNRIAELESLNQQLQASEAEASSVIEQWQASYAGLESKLEALTKECEELKAAMPADGQNDGPSVDMEEKDNRIAELESRNQQLQSSETEASSVIEQWQASYAGLESKLEAVTKECEELKAARPADGQNDGPSIDMEEKDNRIAELESRNQQLQSSEAEASSVIEQWQESYAGLEAKLDALTKECEELKAARPADGQNDGRAMNTEEKDNRIAELESLNRQLQASEGEAKAVVEQWQASYAGLESKHESLTREFEDLKAAQPTHVQTDRPSMNTEEKDNRIAELESLNQQLQASEAEASSVIEQWQASYAGLEAERESLAKEYEELKAAKQTDGQPDGPSMNTEEKDSRIAELESLNEQLQSSEADAAAAIEQWQASYAQLESKLETQTKLHEALIEKQDAGQSAVASPVLEEKDSRIAELESLNQQLQSSEADAAAAIEQWQASYTQLEAKLDALTKEQEELRAENDIDQGASPPVDVEGEDSRVAQLTSQVDSLTQQLEESEAEATAAIEQWQDSYTELEAKLEAVLKGQVDPEGEKVDDHGTTSSVHTEAKDSRIAELTSQVESLTQQLEESEVEATAAIEQWQTSYSELEAKLEVVMKEQEESEPEKVVDHGASSDTRIAELTSRVDRLTQQLEDTEADATATIEQWQESYTELETKLEEVMKEQEQPKAEKVVDSGMDTQQLEESKAEAAAAIEQWRASYMELEAKLEALTKEKEALRSEKDFDQGTSMAADVEEKDSRIAQLASQVDSLTQQLEESEAEAKAAIEQWRASYTELEAKLEVLTKEQEDLRAEKDFDRGTSMSADVEEKDSRIAQLAGQVDSLTQQLEESEAEATAAIKQWEASYAELEARLEAVGKEPEQVGDQASIPSADVEAKEDRIAELASHIENLSMQLEASQTDSTASIKKWQTSYTELQARLETVTKEHEDLKADHVDLGNSHIADLKQKDSRIAELASKVEELTMRLGQEADSAAVIEQWQESYSELESRLTSMGEEHQGLKSTLEERQNSIIGLKNQVQDLTLRLENSEADAARTIDEWQTSYTDLETRNDSLRKEADEFKSKLEENDADAAAVIDQWQESHSNLESQLNTMAKEHEDLCSTLEERQNSIAGLTTQVKDLALRLEHSEADAARAIDEWQASYTDLETRNDSLRKEADELKAQLAEQIPDGLAEKDNRIVQLSAKVDSLTEQLSAEADKTTSLEHWEASYGELESQLKQLAEKEALEITREKGEIMDLAARVETFSQQQSDIEADTSTTIEQWQTLYANIATLESALEELGAKQVSKTVSSGDLDDNVGELESPMQDSSSEPDSISTSEQWETSYVELDMKLQAIMKEQVGLETGLEKKMRESNDLLLLTREVSRQVSLYQSSTDASLNQQIDNLNSEVGELKAKQERSDQDLCAVIPTKDEAKARLSNLEEGMKSYLRGRISDLSAEKQRLQSQSQSAVGQLEVMRRVFDAETGALNSANADLERKVASLADSLKTVGEEKESFEEKLLEASRHDDDRILELQNKVNSLEGEMHQQTKDAEVAIARWESSYKTLEEHASELEKQAKDAKHKQLEDGSQSHLTDETEALKQQLQVETAKWNSMEESLLQKQKELDQLRIDSEATIHVWKARVEELETQVSQLGEDLDQQEKEAVDAIASWETQYHELEEKLGSVSGAAAETGVLIQNLALHEEEIKKLSADLECEKEAVSSKNEIVRELESQIESLQERLGSAAEDEAQPDSGELEKERNARKESDERVADLERKLRETEELFNSRLEASISDRNRVQESLDSQRLIEGEQVEKLETERHILENEKAALTQERDMLKVRVAELVDELQEANDAMQLHVTNEVSDRATELAAEALREQVEEMTVQAEADHKEYLAERQARHFAEQEVARLRADLVALLGMEDSEENNADIHRLTVEAKGKFQRKEIAEIEELKASLDKALEELSSARDAEQRAKEHAAKATLQTSMYEQELVTAKSDLRFLTETMDEMKDAESSRRASLEYRASSLEKDKDVMRQFHSAEMENLRNEITQISMERDRLFQSLKESEISKENLLRASNREGLVPEDASLDPKVEVQVLRMEKAELLSAASEEGTRVERRLHEALTAEKSSTEADLILERELRRSAIRASENLKLELAELKTELAIRVKNPSSNTAPGSPSRAKEVEALKKEIEILTNEKQEQEDRLECWKKEAETKMDRLMEDCRLAKARAMQLERDGRYEAEIRAEVSLLQSNGREDKLVVEADPAEDDAEESTRIAKLYDVIQKQKEAIEEERDVYFKLSEENEDLLAVLAQQELLRESFNAALAEIGGQEAVDAAIRDAEGKAIIKYGKYVKLTY